MSKRFIETELWQDERFLDASSEQKLLTLYLFTNCNYIGIFKKSLRLVSFEIGFTVTEELILSCPLDVEQLKDGRFWLSSFCNFQYGDLKEECRPHRKYISELKKEGLINRVLIGYQKGIDTLEEQDKEQDKEKAKDKKKIKKKQYGEYKNVLLSDEEFEELGSLFQESREVWIEKCSSYVASTGKKYKSHFATIKNWANGDKKKKATPQRETKREKQYEEQQFDIEELML